MYFVKGGEQTRGGKVAIDTLAWIYEHWIPAERVIKTNTWSSELSKLVCPIRLPLKSQNPVKQFQYLSCNSKEFQEMTNKSSKVFVHHPVKLQP